MTNEELEQIKTVVTLAVVKGLDDHIKTCPVARTVNGDGNEPGLKLQVDRIEQARKGEAKVVRAGLSWAKAITVAVVTAVVSFIASKFL